MSEEIEWIDITTVASGAYEEQMSACGRHVRHRARSRPVLPRLDRHSGEPDSVEEWRSGPAPKLRAK